MGNNSLHLDGYRRNICLQGKLNSIFRFSNNTFGLVIMIFTKQSAVLYAKINVEIYLIIENILYWLILNEFSPNLKCAKM